MKQIENILSNELKNIQDSGLYKDERQIESAQSSIITVKGNEVINFCANNYLGLSSHPKIIESAKMDGASHLTTFFRLALPLSIAGIAAFATFQFLWVYNDFLVANVFLGINPRNMVITSHVAQLTVGNYGEAWHLRTSGAVISMIVPLIVFFSLQRFFIKGLIGGAVKG